MVQETAPQGSSKAQLKTEQLGLPPTSSEESTCVTVLDRALVEWLLRLLNNPAFGFALWNGEEIGLEKAAVRSRIHIRSRRFLYRLLLNPGLNFGDLYCSGAIEIEGDLLTLMEDLERAVVHRDCHPDLAWRLLRRTPRKRRCTVSDARQNIHHHYDLGNDFYRLWLDRSAMQYTCAYFADPRMTLEQAQIAKMHHVCRKARLQPGETVVEAGCGWGGLALFMAREYGVKVKAYNISHEQVAFARERARQEGMADQVEYIEDDYRNIEGRYDVFMSVGMLEHVGPENYRTLGAVIDRCLKDSGRGLVHSVGASISAPMNEWLEKRIFPGSYVPTLSEMMNIFEPYAFSVLDVENLRLHYAKTLREWLARFDEHAETIRSLYDDAFIRAWRLYLAGCSASFATGALQLFQVVFNRVENNDLPWSRSHLYESGYGS